MGDVVPRLPSPVVELDDDRSSRRGIRLYLKRDDLIHPDMPGNKWRKLKYNIIAARELGASCLLTFGGAYSNHIRATAAAGRNFGFDTIGVIRGEEHLPLNETLNFAVGQGMKLAYLDRSTYRNKSDPAFIELLRSKFGDFYLIPEGGSNAKAVLGCRELVEEIDVDFDVICCACGTGGTLAGIAAGLGDTQRAVGFAVLRGGSFLDDAVAGLQREALGHVTKNWKVNTDFHFGGFARRNEKLDEFIKSFGSRHGLLLDWIYEAKMMYGMFELIERGSFPEETRIIALIAG